MGIKSNRGTITGLIALSFLFALLTFYSGSAWAGRVIYGKVTDISGKGVANLLVKAYDSDKGKDDFMGQGKTNSGGYYKISYKKRRWDTKVPGTKKQFPDIYVVVYAKIGGRTVKVKKSGVYKDRRHKHNTTIKELKLTGISGVVKDSRGRAQAGVRVKAWDEDNRKLGKHDFMNETTTDSRGYYFMLYEGKHWDPAPHKVTTWRPDIFLKVLRRVENYWVRVARTKTKKDWKHRNHLQINVTIPEDRWVKKFTGFDPVKHGWPFKNSSRKVCGAPTCDKEHWAGKHLRKIARFNWALCGGMSLSALERWKRRMPVTDFSPKVKEELVKAQLRTVAPTVWAKFIKWQAKPNKPHKVALHTIGYDTKKEWSKLKKAIDSGAAIIMGLIRVGPTNNPNKTSNNHQVLAYGYRYNDGTKQVEVYAYDPNHPKEVAKIKMNIGIPRNQIRSGETVANCIHCKVDKAGRPVLATANEKVRGFFVIKDGSGYPGRRGAGSTGRRKLRRR